MSMLRIARHLGHGPAGQHGAANGDEENGVRVYSETAVAGQVLLIRASPELEL